MLLQILPWLRGQVSASAGYGDGPQKRMIATLQHDATILRFVNSHDAPRLAELGTSCPDHFLRTKIKPLYIAWDPSTSDIEGLRRRLADGLEQYRRDYAAYYEACRHPDSPAMRDPNPTVILIPGLGMIAFGKDKSESRVTAEFYNCAVEVMRGAEAIDEYVALPQQEAFDIEYWLLEEAKLQRMPAEKALARRVVVVVGAGSGIGRAVAHRVAAEGAHVVCADLSQESAAATADELTKKYGVGIGVAGSGISGCGPAIGVAVDVTDRASVQRLVRDTVMAYGGLDHVIVTAGIFPTPDVDRPRDRRDVADHVRHQRDGWLPGGRRVPSGVGGAAVARQPGPHHERQRHRREEGVGGVRRVEGRGQPPGADAGRRTLAARARQRAGTRDGRAGIDDVPQGPGDVVAQEVRDCVRSRGIGRRACVASWRSSMRSAR